MEKRFVSVYDQGTSGVKIAFVSCDGELLYSTTENYPLYHVDNNPDYAEQDVEDYWDAVCRGTKALLKQSGLNPQDCAGIAFGTIWKSLIPIDAQGNILRRSIIWMDKRAQKETAELNEYFGVKDLFITSDYWPRLAWFRENEPEIYEKTKYILEVNSYFKWKATGEINSDISNHYIRSTCPQQQELYDRFLAKANLDIDKFPPMCKTTDLVGKVTEKAAEELGLPEGTPVFGGCCDVPALSIGTGCVESGDTYLYYGTGAWIGYTAEQDPSETYTHNALMTPWLDEKNGVSLIGAGAAAGPVTGWMVDFLYGNEKKELGKDIWKFIGEELKKISPGADRLLAAPWVFGSRPPYASEKARGMFVNMKSTHTRAHMMAALLESFGYGTRMNTDMIYEKTGKRIETIVACGGGAKNDYWMQAMADILKVEIKIPQDAEYAGTMGVAYTALIGLGIRKDFSDLKKNLKILKTYTPNPDNFTEYDLLYEQYKKLYPIFKEVFDVLN